MSSESGFCMSAPDPPSSPWVLSRVYGYQEGFLQGYSGKVAWDRTPACDGGERHWVGVRTPGF